MEKIVAKRKLLKSVSIHEIWEADLASDNTEIRHRISISHDFDFLELLEAQTFYEEEEAVLVEELDCFLASL